MRRALTVAVPAMVVLGLVVAAAGPALAHEHRHVGSYELTVGWSAEPAIAGFQNGVQLLVANPDGSPVEDATMQAEIVFGQPDGTEKTQPMDMEPSDENPGEYDAFLIPTRPGTYTFHLTGTIGSQDVDEVFTSSDTAFDDVVEASSLQFPAKDPSTGQLSEKIDRVDSRAASARDEASSAKSSSTTATVLGAVGVVVAIAALIITVLSTRSLRRRSSNP
jgi:YtkA-like